jgi:hypothetical protein
MALPGQATPAGVPAFKLVLVGDGGTGGWAVTGSCICVQGKHFPEKRSPPLFAHARVYTLCLP